MIRATPKLKPCPHCLRLIAVRKGKFLTEEQADQFDAKAKRQKDLPRREGDLSDDLRNAIEDSDKPMSMICDIAQVHESQIRRFLSRERDLSLQTANKITKALNLRLEPSKGPSISLTGQLWNAIEGSEKNHSQLAKLANVNPSQLQRFLSGERDIRLEVAGKLASALGLRLDTPWPSRGPGRPRKSPLVLAERSPENLQPWKTGPIVYGRKKQSLTEKQYRVLRVLQKAGRSGLTGAELRIESRVASCLQILSALKAIDSDWSRLIEFPGAGKRRYKIAFR